MLITPAGTQADSALSAIQAAPGYGKLTYSLPPAGDYRLPSLGDAADGQVLDSSGQPRSLFQIFGKKHVLLSFMYSSCSDVNGCPLSAYVFYHIKAAMDGDPELAKQLKLVSLSFDPTVDTPEAMRLYANNFIHAGGAGEWEFVTTRSMEELQPILDAYHQRVQRGIAPDGSQGTGYSHVLRVFLIDTNRQIRNIYSVSYLHRDLILTDVVTLLRQTEGKPVVDPAEGTLVKEELSQPGDYKGGYELPDYRTRALALEYRAGVAADLIRFIEQPPLGLPAVPVPIENPVTRKKIALGRRLFFDRRLSLNNTFSCAMCHIPEQGFTNNEMAMAIGIEGRSVRRNSPSIYNTAYYPLLFHDGREENLEQQVWGPLLAYNEMGNPSVGSVLRKIRSLPEYTGLFEQAFNGRGVTMGTLGMALASYQRTLVSGDSPFDRWYYGKEADAISISARRGFDLFTGKAGCAACHHVGPESALFTDNGLHNTGLGYRESMGVKPEKRRILLAPGVYMDVRQSDIDQVGATPPTDLGRYEVTEDPHDRWKYKTPGLRNLTLTGPYMHNGSMSTLREVVVFYNQGGVPNPELDPLIRPLGLNDQAIDDLVSFLESLTGSNVDRIVSDAFAAPIGDVTGYDQNQPPSESAGVR